MCDNLKSHSEVVQDVFATKLRDKEEEVEAISNRIKEVQQSLQIVRYGSVTSMSNSSHIYVRKLVKKPKHMLDSTKTALLTITGTQERVFFAIRSPICGVIDSRETTEAFRRRRRTFGTSRCRHHVVR
jgi:hypothetical protein